MINTQINELVAYGLKCGLVSKDDQTKSGSGVI